MDSTKAPFKETWIREFISWTPAGGRILDFSKLDSDQAHIATFSLVSNVAELAMFKASKDIEILWESDPAINTIHPEAYGDHKNLYPPRTVVMVFKVIKHV